MSQTTNSATSIGTVPPGGSLAATFARAAAPSVPNKPMVPTATTQLADHPLDSLRRHIGQPLDYGVASDRGGHDVSDEFNLKQIPCRARRATNTNRRAVWRQVQQ